MCVWNYVISHLSLIMPYGFQNDENKKGLGVMLTIDCRRFKTKCTIIGLHHLWYVLSRA